MSIWPVLPFKLDANILSNHQFKMDLLIEKLQTTENKAGLNNQKVEQAIKKLGPFMKTENLILQHLNSGIDLRAFNILIQKSANRTVEITPAILERISTISQKVSHLTIQTLSQYYLQNFSKIKSKNIFCNWLIKAKRARNTLNINEEKIFTPDGPVWLASEAKKNNRDFDLQVKYLELDHYLGGDYMNIARTLYYIDALKSIPVNQDHEILREVQKKDVHNMPYKDGQLIGHKVLEILIERAPHQNIHQQWLNTVISIAGDSRVPNNSPKYMKWWSQLSPVLIKKVRGWFSELDLKLFLEALENYAIDKHKSEMKRMYPSRKNFLNGLLNRNLIVQTRLYVSKEAESFLIKNYTEDLLPSYSKVIDGDKSLIYVELDHAHVIEGSHSCFLWIYKDMHQSACIFDYSKQKVTYSDLTSGLNLIMKDKGTPAIANISHTPQNWSWQRQAVGVLKNLGSSVSLRDVLSVENFNECKRVENIGNLL